MTAELDFDVQFVATDVGTDAERASFGELTLRAGDAVLTEVIDTLAQTTRTSIFVSVNHLARWLADHWWRLRWEPTPMGSPSESWRVAHEIGAAGGGFVWPWLRFESDGETITLYSRPTFQRHTIRYITECQEFVCSALAFENAIDRFVSQVRSRLGARQAFDVELDETWRAVLEERKDPDFAAFRKHEAYLGLNPGEGDPDELADLFEQGSWLGEGGLDETLAAVGEQHAMVSLARLVALRNDNQLSSLSFGQVSDAIGKWEQEPTPRSAPWQRGDHLARHLRQEWGLENGPVTDEFLNELLQTDIHSDALVAHDAPFLIGFRDDERVRPAFKKHPFKTSRRFAIARLIADAAIARTSDGIHPLTSTRTARQKFQRAAAQELLCPVDSLRQCVSLPRPTDDELVAAAEHFQVSPLLIRNALVNKKLVNRDYLPE